jgi:glycine cleavage system aminomethyltransferase T
VLNTKHDEMLEPTTLPTDGQDHQTQALQWPRSRALLSTPGPASDVLGSASSPPFSVQGSRIAHTDFASRCSST